MNVLYLIAGILLLIVGGDFLVKGSVSLSLKFNISKWIIGLTVVSFATSAPELIVSLNAAIDGHPDLALGNVVGSNIANLALVLAFILAGYGLQASWKEIGFDWLWMIAISALLPIALISTGGLNFMWGLLFVLILVSYMMVQIRKSKNEVVEMEDEVASAAMLKPLPTVGFLLLGAIALYAGSEVLIEGAVGLASTLGVSERVISISMVSVGTSIPELAASVIAVKKKEGALSVSNLIGSNIFNICSVLGITAIIHPITSLDPSLLRVDVWVMLAVALSLLVWTKMSKTKMGSHIFGFILLSAYAIYILTIF